MELTYEVFLVKFDKGYYSEKQPGYDWSYTDNPLEAHKYKTEKAAILKGKHGINLFTDSNVSYEIEKYKITYTMEKV